MTNKMILFFTAVSLAATTLGVRAQTNDSTPRKVIERTNTLKATVEDIDYDKREITLKGPKGNSSKFAVSDDVKRFSNIKKGDEVWIGYYQAVAFAIGKPGETLSPTSGSVRISRDPGNKPAGTASQIVHTTATVEDIDREKREVTLKGAGGNTVVVEVSPEVGNLQRIQKGDQLEVNYTEAVVFSVEKPEDRKSTRLNFS